MIIYLLIIFLIGIPIMIAELTLGRAGKGSVIGVFKKVVPGKNWWFIGLFPLLASLIILSFYSVVAGWTLLYIVSSLSGVTAGLESAGLGELFGSLTASPVYPLLGQGVFILITVAIVIVGVKRGIERWGKVLMPGILVLLLILLGRVAFLEGFWSGVRWFLTPDPGAFSFGTALEAVGQVFFSFSLGMGAILTYGSYLPSNSNIPRNSFYISLTDLGVALLTGLIVIPALFVFNISPETGPGLIFITLPAVFNTLPFSMFWTTLFFILLAFAALTSAISLLEVTVAYLIEEQGWSRAASALLTGIVIFTLSIPAALSEGIWSNLLIAGRNIFDLLDFTASNIMLPLGSLLTVIFVGWIWGTRNAMGEILQGHPEFRLGLAWSILIRLVAPAAIAYILIAGIGS